MNYNSRNEHCEADILSYQDSFLFRNKSGPGRIIPIDRLRLSGRTEMREIPAESADLHNSTRRPQHAKKTPPRLPALSIWEAC